MMLLAVALLPTEVLAQEVPTSGTSGDLTWKAETTDKMIAIWDKGNFVRKPAYRLTFSGTGEMADYEEDTPWCTLVPLYEVVLGEGVASIGDNAFAGALSMPAVNLPSTLKRIGQAAFSGTGLSDLVIPDKVTTIGAGAFRNCSELHTLTIGKGVTSIGKEAFVQCGYLAFVTCYVNPAALTWEGYDNASSFMNGKGTEFRVRKGYLTAWQEKFPGINATFVGDLDDEAPVSAGDANGDSEVNVADIDFVIELIGADAETHKAADVNGDSEINVADVDYIIERIV